MKLLGERLDNPTAGELEDLAESHHTELLVFARDDGGTWYGRVNTDLGYCSASHWRSVTPVAQDVLDKEHARVRDTD